MRNASLAAQRLAEAARTLSAASQALAEAAAALSASSGLSTALEESVKSDESGDMLISSSSVKPKETAKRDSANTRRNVAVTKARNVELDYTSSGT